MKKMKREWAWRAAAMFCVLLMCAMCIPCALADGEAEIYTVYDESGEVLFTLAGQVEAGDEYISAGNNRYVIEKADPQEKTARAAYEGKQTMPDVGWMQTSAAVAVSAAEGGEKRLIALYCTHSDESYKPSDGETSNDQGKGGIYDVSRALAQALEARGIETALETTSHVPHDAGAYRRSRQTALELMKQRPDVLLDIHRDGIPDPAEYETTVSGEEISKVRLLVGRSNQNAAANKQFALELKAVADASYPGLIKDIFIGKGSYNQDLMAQSILLEFGTHTTEKEMAIRSADMMADVISTSVYGGVSGAATDGEKASKETDSAARTSAGLVLIAALLAAVAFALLQTGGGKAAWNKMKSTAREMTGGMLGKKKKE